MRCHYTETGKGCEAGWNSSTNRAGDETIDDEGYKYLGILELDEIMEERMKDKFTNEYYRRLIEIDFEIKAKRKEQIPSYKYLDEASVV